MQSAGNGAPDATEARRENTQLVLSIGEDVTSA